MQQNRKHLPRLVSDRCPYPHGELTGGGFAVSAGGNVVRVRVRVRVRIRVATAPNGFVKRKLIKIMSFRANVTSSAR